jgi:hypothetical protein
MMLVPVALVLHFTVPPQPVAVKVAVSVPHKLVLLLAIVGADGFPPEVIVITLDAPLVPQLLTQTALYVPAEPTERVLPVVLVFHFTVPPQPVAVRVAVSAPHKLALLVVTVGGDGITFFLITIFWLGLLSPQTFLQVAL